MILTVCIAFSLAACGGSAGSSAGSSAASGSTGSSASAGSAGSDTLVVDIWDNNQLDGLQQIADE